MRRAVGYALGGGVEYAFTEHWTAKVEALYINLSNGSNRPSRVSPTLGKNCSIGFV
jgi:outer membrane immunogenic protein